MESIREKMLNYFLNTPSVFAIYFDSGPGIYSSIYFDDQNLRLLISYLKSDGTVSKNVDLNDIPDIDLISKILPFSISNESDIPECVKERDIEDEERSKLHSWESWNRKSLTLWWLFFDGEIEYDLDLLTNAYIKSVLSINWTGKTLDDLKKVFPFTETFIYETDGRRRNIWTSYYHERVKGDETIFRDKISLSFSKVEEMRFCKFELGLKVYVMEINEDNPKEKTKRLISIKLHCGLYELFKVVNSLPF